MFQAEENNHEHVTNELKAKETSLKLAEVSSSVVCFLCIELYSGMGIKNGKVSAKVGAWGLFNKNKT